MSAKGLAPTPTTAAAAGVVDELLLKVTPPRVPRDLVVRPQLGSADERFRDRVVILVQAPPGFGKTSLLAQWRREHLAQGAVVAWLSARAQDDPQRLVHSLALSVRLAAGRPTFGHTLLGTTAPGGFEGITIWLAELAQTALNVVLIVDEAERLPTASRDALAYLLRNAPQNLRAVVAARAGCHLDLDDLVDYGQCVVIGPPLLRFQLDETIALVRKRFGARVDNDACARLHELTEGWPLGLQLALSVVANSPDPGAQVGAIAAHAGSGLREHLVGLLLSNLDPGDVAFLTRIVLLDYLHPDLCRAVTGADDAAERLARMGRDTPVFVGDETGEWLRMHALARDALRQRFAELPAAEQAGLHGRASAWLAGHGMLEAAATHALAAGQRERAYELAERSLYESVMTRGRLGTALEWLQRLPSAQLDQRPRLLLAAAWSLALGERHEEAGRLVARILAAPGADDALRCECALILSGAAVFADEPDRFAELHDPWAEDRRAAPEDLAPLGGRAAASGPGGSSWPPLRDPLLLQVHANRSAFRTLLEGEPALARLRQQQAPRGDFAPALGYVSRWGEFIIGQSYVWEGQVLLAENLLRPTLARADADLGRRSPFSCMLAALLAAAVWERDRADEAAALLANRLDVLEHSGLPETVLLAYRTLARVAMADGAEHRALEMLGALDAVGSARRLPRLRIASLTDQVRMHARRYRAETCRALAVRIDALLLDDGLPKGRLWRRSVDVLRDLAHGYAAIAAQDWRAALNPLARADAAAQQLQQGRLHVELLGLRAFVLDRRGERSQALLHEAMDLATSHGLLRVFDDAHPALGDWVRNATQDVKGTGLAGPLAAPVQAPRERVARPEPRATPSTALTPKEREVLALLARNLSNKEIGLAMQVGEETVKWHVKNLFAKLDAGTRKQVVQRARILGLLEADGL